MKSQFAVFTRYKIFVTTLCLVVSTQLFFLSSAFSQIDYYYGKTPTGFRIGGGVGVSTLMTHYASNPPSPGFVGDLDYAFNPYFSIGTNFQFGKLLGKDTQGEFYYQSSSDSYSFADLELRAGLGLINNFDCRNQFMDALKRTYIGLGMGTISTNIKFVYNPAVTTAYGNPQPKGNYTTYTFDLGTYIDLPGVWGTDKVELNPNFQFSEVNSLYLDGFQSKATSTLKGFFNVTSITLRYKF